MKTVTGSLIPLVLAAACATHAGNQASLTPMVHQGATDTVQVSSKPGLQVAAFAVMTSATSRHLQFLGADDGAGAITLSGAPGPQDTPLPYVSGTQTRWGFTDACVPRIGRSDFQDERVTYSCTEELPSPPVWSGPAAVVRQRPSFVFSGYIVVLASNTHVSALRWQELADSLGVLRALSGAPRRLGLLAFGEGAGTRWGATLVWLPGFRGAPDVRWVDAP